MMATPLTKTSPFQVFLSSLASMSKFASHPISLIIVNFIISLFIILIYSSNILLFALFGLFGTLMIIVSQRVENRYLKNTSQFQRTLLINKISWLLQTVKNHSINIFTVLSYLDQNLGSSPIPELQLIYRYYNLEYALDSSNPITSTPFAKFHENENYTDSLLQLSKAVEDQGSYTLSITSLLPLSFLFLSILNTNIIWIWPFLTLFTFITLQFLNSSSTGLTMKLTFLPYTNQIEFLKRLKYHSQYEFSPHKLLFLADNSTSHFNLFDTPNLPTLLDVPSLSDPILKAIVHQVLLITDVAKRTSILEELISRLITINSTIKQINRDQKLIRTRFILMQGVLSFGLGVISFLLPFFSLILQSHLYPPLLFHTLFLLSILTQPIYSESPLYSHHKLQAVSLSINLFSYFLASFFASVFLSV